VGITDTISNKK